MQGVAWGGGAGGEPAGVVVTAAAARGWRPSAAAPRPAGGKVTPGRPSGAGAGAAEGNAEGGNRTSRGSCILGRRACGARLE